MKKIWVALLLSFSGCTHVFYQPSDEMLVRDPHKLDKFREEVTFKNPDGLVLTGWYFKARSGAHKGTVIQFHGNAENMTSHFASVVWMIDEGYDFFTFDYRGYGKSEGTPSQEGLNQDALTAIRYVMGRNSNEQHDLILYGQSLGGAVLLRAQADLTEAERKRVRGVVSESAFYDYHEIAKDVLGRHWFTIWIDPLVYVLVSDKYSAEDSISKVSPIPLIVIHGDRDPVVPYHIGEEIFALAHEPKFFIPVPGGGHIDSMWVRKGEFRPRFLKLLDSFK
jgi:fermentation-respiration switch protein FrsA (DUF1100 family)